MDSTEQIEISAFQNNLYEPELNSHRSNSYTIPAEQNDLFESQSKNSHGSAEQNDLFESKSNSIPAEQESQESNSNPVKAGNDFFLVPVTTPDGEEFKMKLKPTYSGIGIKALLSNDPRTCFYTCYDLFLCSNAGSLHQLEDYVQICGIAGITLGDCSMNMIAAPYNDITIRDHINRTRELLSLPSLDTSFSTTLAPPHEVDEGLKRLHFIEDVSGAYSNMLFSSPRDSIISIGGIWLSTFNPPPCYRRLYGDLLYIDVVTIEGLKYCISGTTNMFFVNSSDGFKFDPAPKEMSFEASSLVGLLQKISVEFKEDLPKVLKRMASIHPLERSRLLLPKNSWLGMYPVPDHKRDAARAEFSHTLTFGSEPVGLYRDWNDEIQSAREFSRKSYEERNLRDRALHKISTEFVHAAINGAIAVIDRCIPPINPHDPGSSFIYVHNNIVFSFAMDSDIEKFCYVDSPEKTMLSVTEQATYASSNNELNATKILQEADVCKLYNLTMAVIDYRGYRIIARSILPGTLLGDRTQYIRYGSVDSCREIRWDQSVHSKVLEASKHLRLKEHTVLDGSGVPITLAVPVECKVVVGSDGRDYILDLLRVTPRDLSSPGLGSRDCILRPELIASFCQRCTQNGKGCVTDSAASNHGLKDVYFNPNVFTEFKLAGSSEEISADEKLVREVNLYLKGEIQKFVGDLRKLIVSPMDGRTLTDALHAYGINVRYVGEVATAVKDIAHLWDLCLTEIIIRSVKHIFNDFLRNTEDHVRAIRISHFLNCLFGSVEANAPNIVNDSRGEGYKDTVRGQHRWRIGLYAGLSTENLWNNITLFARNKYKFELPNDAISGIRKIAVLRNFCQKVGLTIAARKYDFNAAKPFEESYILCLHPVVKDSIPFPSRAKELMEDGKYKFAEGRLVEAFKSFSEASALLQDTTGPMHLEVATCLRFLATVLYQKGDFTGALELLQQELIINERCLGLDHPDTSRSYMLMALFYHGLKQSELALGLMCRALLLLSLSSGPHYPEVSAAFHNVAMMYSGLGKKDNVLRYLHQALMTNEKLFGKGSVESAISYHALAVAYYKMGIVKVSYKLMKKGYPILVKQLGKENSYTLVSKKWKNFFANKVNGKVQRAEDPLPDQQHPLYTLFHPTFNSGPGFYQIH